MRGRGSDRCCKARTSSIERMVSLRSGPFSSSMSKGIPTPGSGVRISLRCGEGERQPSGARWRMVRKRTAGAEAARLKRMTPSGRKARKGWRVVSTIRSVFSDLRGRAAVSGTLSGAAERKSEVMRTSP